MTRIRIQTAVPYEVEIGAGVSAAAPQFVRETLSRARKAAVVTDSNLEPLHAASVVAGFSAAGLETGTFVFPAGERSKTLATYGSLLDFLAAHRLDRTDVVVALGGGVTGDMAGFAAATYKRGIAFVQIPTSLLAMVDSSVGGKTGVDLPAGKNLVGAFHQPRAVFCDMDFLVTLPENWRMDGMGEVLKYAILGDVHLFAKLERQPRAPIGECEIAECVGMKRDIVERDEREGNVRKLLNLGHTFAHAIETLSGYAVSHGRAVATGLAMAAHASVKAGALAAPECARIEALVTAMGYATHVEFSTDALVEAMLSDKKVSGDAIDFVLPQTIGKCFVKRTPLAEIGKVVEDAR